MVSTSGSKKPRNANARRRREFWKRGGAERSRIALSTSILVELGEAPGASWMCMVREGTPPTSKNATEPGVGGVSSMRPATCRWELKFTRLTAETVTMKRTGRTPESTSFHAALTLSSAEPDSV